MLRLICGLAYQYVLVPLSTSQAHPTLRLDNVTGLALGAIGLVTAFTPTTHMVSESYAQFKQLLDHAFGDENYDSNNEADDEDPVSENGEELESEEARTTASRHFKSLNARPKGVD